MCVKVKEHKKREAEEKAKQCQKEINNGVGTVGTKNEGDAWAAITWRQQSQQPTEDQGAHMLVADCITASWPRGEPEQEVK